MSRSIILCLLGLAGCTFTWNAGEPALPLSGSPPSLSSLTRLSTVPSSRATLMLGADGAPWAAFCEFATDGTGGNGRGCRRMRLRRLDDVPGDESIEADGFQLHYTELYVIHEDPDTVTRAITLHHPGAAASDDVTFQLPGGRASYGSTGDPSVFFYWALETVPPTWTTHRRDLSYERNIPIPPEIDPTGMTHANDIAIALDPGGTRLVLHSWNGTMTIFSTVDEATFPIGQTAPDFVFDEDHGAVVTYGTDGVRSIPLDGSLDKYLSNDKVDQSSVGITATDFLYGSPSGVWRVSLDGSTAPVLIQAGAARARAVSQAGAVAYGYDASTLYTGAAGDGWLDGWQFMERGRGLRFSADGKRLHFLEHAATLGTYGDLTTATDRATANRLLGINVHAYDELPDGRLVAIENAIERGTWNRLVLIDEAHGDKRWLAPSTAEMFVVPGGHAVLANVVADGDLYDIYLAPVPDA
jgi:hypothetical protein